MNHDNDDDHDVTRSVWTLACLAAPDHGQCLGVSICNSFEKQIKMNEINRRYHLQVLELGSRRGDVQAAPALQVGTAVVLPDAHMLMAAPALQIASVKFKSPRNLLTTVLQKSANKWIATRAEK